jgi:nucleoside-diphosphate-sugar epimerase
MDFAGRRVFVTGATGLLGSGVCRRLLDEGAHVTGLARSSERAAQLTSLGVTVVAGDLSRADSGLETALEGCSVVVHCAGVMAPDFDKPRAYFRTVNVEGVRRLADAALAAHVERFVHVSTAWVYGFDAKPGTNEDSPRHPSGDSYCDTKLEAEELVHRLVRERDLPAVIVQPTEVYGPEDRSWTLTPLRLIRSGRMLLMSGGAGVIQPIFVDDAVEGILAAARWGAVGQDYLLAGPAVVSCADFFGHYGEMVGRTRTPSIPAWLGESAAVLLTGVSRITHRPPLFTRTTVRGTCLQATYDGTKARVELGFEPRTDLETGMRAVREWLRATGELD